MLKLSTPSQYELSIEGINILRPLKLADTRKIDITSPVLDVSLPVKTSPVAGKLAKCDGTGSLLKTKNVSYDNYQFIAKWIDINYNETSIVFAQKVFQVYVKTLDSNFPATTWWTNPMWSRFYFPMDTTFAGMIPFTGQVMYLNSNCSIYDYHVLGFYGFY